MKILITYQYDYSIGANIDRLVEYCFPLFTTVKYVPDGAYRFVMFGNMDMSVRRVSIRFPNQIKFVITPYEDLY